MNETVTWRTWSVIQDQPVLHWESWWIQPLVSKLEEKTGISSLLCGWREAPILLLYLPPASSASPGCFQRENATTAEQLRLQRFSPGFILTLTQDGPQFRTQRLGQASRRYILFLWEWSIPFLFTVIELVTLFFLFLVFSPLLHPHTSASLSSHLPHSLHSSLSPLP